MKKTKEFLKKHQDEIIITISLLALTAVAVSSIILIKKTNVELGKEGKIILEALKNPGKNGLLTKKEVLELLANISDNAKYAIFKESIDDAFAVINL